MRLEIVEEVMKSERQIWEVNLTSLYDQVGVGYERQRRVRMTQVSD